MEYIKICEKKRFEQSTCLESFDVDLLFVMPYLFYFCNYRCCWQADNNLCQLLFPHQPPLRTTHRLAKGSGAMKIQTTLFAKRWRGLLKYYTERLFQMIWWDVSSEKIVILLFIAKSLKIDTNRTILPKTPSNYFSKKNIILKTFISDDLMGYFLWKKT